MSSCRLFYCDVRMVSLTNVTFEIQVMVFSLLGQFNPKTSDEFWSKPAQATETHQYLAKIPVSAAQFAVKILRVSQNCVLHSDVRINFESKGLIWCFAILSPMSSTNRTSASVLTVKFFVLYISFQIVLLPFCFSFSENSFLTRFRSNKGKTKPLLSFL